MHTDSGEKKALSCVDECGPLDLGTSLAPNLEAQLMDSLLKFCNRSASRFGFKRLSAWDCLSIRWQLNKTRVQGGRESLPSTGNPVECV